MSGPDLRRQRLPARFNDGERRKPQTTKTPSEATDGRRSPNAWRTDIVSQADMVHFEKDRTQTSHSSQGPWEEPIQHLSVLAFSSARTGLMTTVPVRCRLQPVWPSQTRADCKQRAKRCDAAHLDSAMKWNQFSALIWEFPRCC